MYEFTKDDQDLVNRIKAKVQADKTNDYPTVTMAEIIKAEKSLGFELPDLMREIYMQVGNGGFGPGYGIIGLEGGHQVLKRNLVDSYYESMEFTEGITRGKYISPQWRWEKFHLLYNDWGCAICHNVDCSSKHLSVLTTEGESFRGLHSSKNLRQWWEKWLDGTIELY